MEEKPYAEFIEEFGIDKCNLCGRCNERSKLTLLKKEEKFSPRFKLFMLKNEMYNDFFFYDAGEDYSGACPFGVVLDFRKMNPFLISRGVLPEKIQKLVDEFYGKADSKEEHLRREEKRKKILEKIFMGDDF